MLINNQSEKHPESKLKPAAARTFVKESVHNFFEKMSKQKKSFVVDPHEVLMRFLHRKSMRMLLRVIWTSIKNHRIR